MTQRRELSAVQVRGFFEAVGAAPPQDRSGLLALGEIMRTIVAGFASRTEEGFVVVVPRMGTNVPNLGTAVRSLFFRQTCGFFASFLFEEALTLLWFHKDKAFVRIYRSRGS